MADETTELTTEQINKYRTERVNDCSRKIAEILETYNCDLVAVPQINADGRIVAIVQLVFKS